MNAPFSAVFRTLNGTAASLSALHETLRRMEAETRTALRLNDQNRGRHRRAFRRLRARVRYT